MTVRLKAATLVVVSFVIAFVAIDFLAQRVLVPSYASLENRQVDTSVAQALHAVDARIDTLDATNHDWASWDDTYNYVLTGSPEYVSSNLVDETFSAIGVDVIVILDSSGDALFARAFDFQDNQSIEAPADLFPHLAQGSFVASRSAASESTSGIINLSEGAMLVSARPILTSAETGPPRGLVFMGAFVSPSLVQQIGDVTSLAVSVTPVGLSEAGPSGVNPTPVSSAGNIHVTPRGANTIEGQSIINDLYGQPALMVRVTQNRDIYAEGQRTLTFLLVAIGVGGGLLLVLFLIALDRAILRRLSRLAEDVRSVGAQPDFSGQVAVDGDDDIAFLASTINETLGSLAHTHRELMDSHSELERTNANLQRAKEDLSVAANQLRRLTLHVQSMREDEQAFVAKEIRDQIGQGLTAVKMDLSSLQRTYSRGDTPSPEFVQRIGEVVDGVLETVRRLSSGLRSSTLEDLGLTDGFEWQLTEFGREKGIKTSLVVEGPTADVEAGRALTLFRILQEALLVSAEDPSTSEVAVSLTIENAYALLALRDNGTTVLTGDALARREIGLSLIRERTEIFGGGLSIDSSSESGTRIVAQIPL